MVRPFYHEQRVEVEGEPLRLVLNFGAIDAAESILAPLTFDQIIGQMLDGSASLATQARVIWGLLREHHPELSIDQATAVVVGSNNVAIGVAVGNLIQAAFPLKSDKEETGANPPKPRGASRNS